MKLTFLDFEATGLIEKNKDLPEVIQAALKIVDGDNKKFINEFFQISSEKLSPIVKAVTGIQEKDLHAKAKTKFKDSNLLKQIISNQNTTIQIAHNGIGYDFKLLEPFNYQPKFLIDTLKIAKSILSEEDSELVNGKFKLPYLRFLFQDKGFLDNDYVNKPINFHTADYDVETLEQVFYAFIKYYQSLYPEKTEAQILVDFINISKNPILLKTINFGKHSGVKFSELDSNYLNWLNNNIVLKGEADEDLKFTVEYYLNGGNQNSNTENERSQSASVEVPKIEIKEMPKPIISNLSIDDSEINEANFSFN